MGTGATSELGIALALDTEKKDSHVTLIETIPMKSLLLIYESLDFVYWYD